MQPYLDQAKTIAIGFFTQYGLDVLGAFVILIAGWLVSRWASAAVRRFADRTAHLGPTIAPVLATAARMGVLALALVATLNKLGVDTTSLVAAVGALGLGIGLALKDTLSDVASGIVILFLRPFDVGDDTDINGIEGTITSVDVLETKLTGFDGVPVVLPNKKVREGMIRNYSRAERRRIDLQVGIAYGADVDAAIETLKSLLADDERVMSEPAPIINVTALADSSVNLLVRFNIPPKDWVPVHMDIRRKVKLALDEAGIPIPFPQRVVTMVNAA